MFALKKTLLKIARLPDFLKLYSDMRKAAAAPS